MPEPAGAAPPKGRGSAAVAHGARSRLVGGRSHDGRHHGRDWRRADLGQRRASGTRRRRLHRQQEEQHAHGQADCQAEGDHERRPGAQLPCPGRHTSKRHSHHGSGSGDSGRPSRVVVERVAGPRRVAGHWSEVWFGGCASYQHGDRPKRFGGRPCQRHEAVAHEGGGHRHRARRRAARLARPRRARIPRELWCGPTTCRMPDVRIRANETAAALAGAEDVRRRGHRARRPSPCLVERRHADDPDARNRRVNGRADALGERPGGP